MSTAGEISGDRQNTRRYERGDRDWFVEPAWTVEALLNAESLEGTIWDPACGGGTINHVLSSRGLRCFNSDIVDRGCGRQHDFLGTLAKGPFGAVDNVVTNPPYNVAQAFAERALEFATRKVALLVQAKFLYSQARFGLFTGNPVARIYHLSSRPSMPPGALLRDGKIKAAGGKMDFLWIVFQRGYFGPPTAHWLRRPAGTR